MRLAIIALALTSSMALRICGSSDAPPPTSAAPPTSVAAPAAGVDVQAQAQIAPTHGGTVVTVQDQPVEVVPQRDGVIRAYMVGSEPPAADARVMVEVKGNDGQQHPVNLTWDPTVHYYVGRADVHPVPGPVVVAVDVGGRVETGHATRVVVVPPRVAVDVVGPHGEVRVHGAPPPVRAGVDVRVNVPPPPSLNLRIGLPGVRVVHEQDREIDEHHDVRVIHEVRVVHGHGHHDNGLHLGEVRHHGHHGH